MSNPFNQDYIDFFTELAFNNEKAWFDKNRKRYEQSVREPFKQFTAEMIAEIQKFDSSVGPLEPKDVMFRINRDIRFSNDKTPYNTWLSAAILSGGKKKSDTHPGYYFRFAVDGVQLGGGMYHPEKEYLHSLRTKIMNNPQVIHKILTSPQFKKSWGGELHGDKNKVIPKEFKEAAQDEPLLYNKGFTFWHKGPETDVLRPDLKEWMVGMFKDALPVVEFLRAE